MGIMWLPTNRQSRISKNQSLNAYLVFGCATVASCRFCDQKNVQNNSESVYWMRWRKKICVPDVFLQNSLRGPKNMCKFAILACALLLVSCEEVQRTTVSSCKFYSGERKKNGRFSRLTEKFQWTICYKRLLFKHVYLRQLFEKNTFIFGGYKNTENVRFLFWIALAQSRWVIREPEYEMVQPKEKFILD